MRNALRRRRAALWTSSTGRPMNADRGVAFAPVPAVEIKGHFFGQHHEQALNSRRREQSTVLQQQMMYCPSRCQHMQDLCMACCCDHRCSTRQRMQSTE